MRTSRVRLSFLGVLCVALAGAVLLVTPREFDRVRLARGGSQRLDFADASHEAVDDQSHAACALTPGDDGVGGGDTGSRTDGSALAITPFALPAPSRTRANIRPLDRPALPWRIARRPPARAPPHA